ncbi:MAG TPA: DAHL domain-containing protein [Nevskiales bacterium]|nr:DAHL domain-containing protein [Nevskiales bacterium]
MKLRMLIPALLAGMAIAVLVFLLRMTQTVDNDLHLERLRLIRAVDALDVQLNRAVTQSGVATMTQLTAARADTTRRLGEVLDELDKGPKSLRGLSPELDRALDTFLDTIQDKSELAFDFEARNVLLNQRLINAMDGVAVQADAVLAAADAAAQERVRELTLQLKAEITTLGVIQGQPETARIKAALDELDEIGKTQSEAFREAQQALRLGAEGVIADKTELVDKVGGFLGRPTGPQLEAMERAYMDWHGRQVAIANRYRLLLAGYAAFLLIVLAGLGVRLRNSYRELDRANDKLREANETLESQVQERTKDLRKALKDLQESEAQLIQSEKMASLGQMVAGVAHEINTPLGYARSNTRMVRSSLEELRDVIAAQDQALRLLTAEQATEEQVAQALAEAQQRREAVNPAELVGDLDTLLDDASHGLTQIAELVSSLKDFSRVDRSRADLFNVNDGLESALKICHNQIKDRIEVVRHYGELPEIECAPSQLNQVFLNLLTNAAQAIEGEGKILLHTTAEQDGVCIRILDTGCGMSEEVRARIFEPFFTTKPVGKGTGLGLSIVYRIIEDHGGRIEVRSVPGKGSEFIIRLPLRQQAAPAESAATPLPRLAAV